MRTDYCGLIDTKHLNQQLRFTAGCIAAAIMAELFSLICATGKAWCRWYAIPTTRMLLESPKKFVTSSYSKLTGRVRHRPEGTVNTNLVSGEIEVLVQSIEILNTSLTPPFLMDDENLSETVRLEHRYLDLRRPQMQANLRLRYKVAMAVRVFLDRHGFHGCGNSDADQIDAGGCARLSGAVAG